MPYFPKDSRNFNEVIINKELYNLIDNKTFECTFESHFIYENIEETFSLNQNFKVIDIVEEMVFLNTPKIYYNYYQAILIAKNLISTSNKSYYEIIAKSQPTSAISNYQLIIHLKSDVNLDRFYQIVNEGLSGFEITSNSIVANKSLSEIYKSVELFLLIFGAILGISTIAILIFVITSLIYDNKKETAILIAIGKKSHTFLINYLFEFYLMISVAGLLNAFLMSFIKSIFNKILAKQFGLLYNLKVFVPLVTLILAISLISTIVIYVVYKVVGNTNHIKLLREE